jgi:putative transposase
MVEYSERRSGDLKVATSGRRLHRKQMRLAASSYLGVNLYSLTVCTASREPFFREAANVSSCASSLIDAAMKENFTLLVYVFMPDHLHLLVEGTEKASLPAFVKRFKQSSGFEFKAASGALLWQKGYYDHVLRRQEAIEDVARYVLENPVRAGLVQDWNEYPFIGGVFVDEASDGDLKVAATVPKLQPPLDPLTLPRPSLA